MGSNPAPLSPGPSAHPHAPPTPTFPDPSHKGHPHARSTHTPCLFPPTHTHMPPALALPTLVGTHLPRPPSPAYIARRGFLPWGPAMPRLPCATTAEGGPQPLHSSLRAWLGSSTSWAPAASASTRHACAEHSEHSLVELPFSKAQWLPCSCLWLFVVTRGRPPGQKPP